MTDAMDQAVARTDKAFLDIALRNIAEMQLTTNPLVNDLRLDITKMVLQELYERISIRTQ